MGFPLAMSRERFWNPMSIMAPSPPMLRMGGQRWNSSSVNWRQSKASRNAWNASASYEPSASCRALRMDTKWSDIFRMCPSKTPMAMLGASWKRWFTQGKGYGLYG